MNVDTNGEFLASLERLQRVLSRPGEGRERLLARGATLLTVEDALKRYREGNYGFCSACRLSIPRSELLMRPYAATCRACHSQKGSGKYPLAQAHVSG